VVQEKVLERVDSESLTVIAVWMPVMVADGPDKGLEAEALFPDHRVTHYWDGDSELGRYYGQVLTLPEERARPGLAWDVYFVFAPGAEWQERPPAPDEWMHQLGMDARRLDGDALRQTIVDLLP
jgi:hypothetical protein